MNDKRYSPRKEDVSIRLQNDPSERYKPTQDAVYYIDCRIDPHDHLIFEPDPSMYFPRIIPYKEDTYVILYLTLNVVKYHYVKIYNHTDIEFDYIVDNAQIADLKRDGMIVEIKLNLKAIPDSFLIAATSDGYQAIVKKAISNKKQNISIIHIYRDDLVLAQKCISSDWQIRTEIKVLNYTKEEFSYKASAFIDKVENNSIYLRSKKPLDSVLISVLNPCYKTFTKKVEITNEFNGSKLVITNKDLVEDSSLVKVRIKNNTNKILSFSENVTLKPEENISITTFMPSCSSKVNVVIAPIGYFAFTKKVEINTITLTGQTSINPPDLIPIPPTEIKNEAHYVKEQLIAKNYRIKNITVNAAHKYFPNKSLGDSLDQFSGLSIAFFNLRGFDFLFSTYFNSYLKSPQFQAGLVYNNLGNYNSDEFHMSAEFVYNFSSNEKWKYIYNMSTFSMGLNVTYYFLNSNIAKYGILWIPRVDFSNFKKHSNDPDIENIRFMPSLLLEMQTIYREHDIYIVSGVVREAFYTSLLFAFKHKIEFGYTFKGKSYNPPPQTPLESAGFHQIGIGYRF
ncbi:MAG: hypothetical protein JXI43_10695 [Tissierellales bacterium]|nr:hypothetical protein [Tissierellales bacterium]